MKTPIAFLSKSPHSSLPSTLATSAVIRGITANSGATATKPCGGGPKLGRFNRAKAGS